jgi:hydroxymethylpyrimidine/phosphomethylpyrimidine kinase
MVATSGAALLQDEAIQAYERDLFPLAALLTPNLGEATRLLGRSITDLATMREAGKTLEKKYGVPVLLKGGHLTGDDAIDLLFMGGSVAEFSAPFSRSIATHGTGCTYSAAITAGLAGGLPLEEAIRRAKKFVTAAIAQHHAWDAAQGTSVHALNHSPTD